MAQAKGQISIFLIAAIVIAGVMGLSYYMLSLDNGKTAEVVIQTSSQQNEAIIIFVNSCLKTTVERGLYIIGLQGGYYQNARIEGLNGTLFIPFYWDKTENAAPPIQKIEEELSLYVKQNLPNCLDGLSDFKKQGYAIDTGTMGVDAVIGSNEVGVSILYTIGLSFEGKRIEVDHFSSSVPSEFKNRYTLINEIMEEQKKTPSAVPISFIGKLAYEQHFNFTNIYISPDTILFSFSFPEEGNIPFIYNFANRYNWSGSHE